MHLYKAMIRPHLEYAVTLLKGDIEHLEKVQCRATKLVPEIKDLAYKDRFKHLELPTLVYRRNRGDMIKVLEIYKPKDTRKKLLMERKL